VSSYLRDVEQAVDYYAREAGERVALEFLEELRRAYRFIANAPAAGSPFHGQALNLQSLRSRILQRYPYIIFYIECQDHIDVWRVLHAQRDIPASLQGY
jgi:toxin ParE1/3/4